MGDLISRVAAMEALGECPYNWNDWPEEIQAVNDWESHKYDSAEYAAKAIRKPIPADIAEKLGIEPKEASE